MSFVRLSASSHVFFAILLATCHVFRQFISILSCLLCLFVSTVYQHPVMSSLPVYQHSPLMHPVLCRSCQHSLSASSHVFFAGLSAQFISILSCLLCRFVSTVYQHPVMSSLPVCQHSLSASCHVFFAGLSTSCHVFFACLSTSCHVFFAGLSASCHVFFAGLSESCQSCFSSSQFTAQVALCCFRATTARVNPGSVAAALVIFNCRVAMAMCI